MIGAPSRETVAKREDKEKEEGGVKDEARLTERRVVGYLPIIHARDRCNGRRGEGGVGWVLGVGLI